MLCVSTSTHTHNARRAHPHSRQDFDHERCGKYFISEQGINQVTLYTDYKAHFILFGFILFYLFILRQTWGCRLVLFILNLLIKSLSDN